MHQGQQKTRKRDPPWLGLGKEWRAGGSIRKGLLELATGVGQGKGAPGRNKPTQEAKAVGLQGRRAPRKRKVVGFC